MERNIFAQRYTLNVLRHALDFFIEHADINEPLEREYICASIRFKVIIDEELKEIRKRKQNHIINPKN
jgi:hypothetical protein